jgi:hypothetical protein
MKSYSTQQISPSIWKEIDSIFWRSIPLNIVKENVNGTEILVSDSDSISRFLGGHSFDGLVPENVVTDKDGITIEGEYSTLPTCDTFKVQIVFKRPNFSSVQSITENKLRNSMVEEYTVNTIKKESILVLI